MKDSQVAAKKILIVEGEPGISMICHRTLTDEGYEVDIAVSGEMAESMIKRKQKKYYRALQLSDKKGNSSPFIEFMLITIKEAMEDFIKDARPEPQNSETRLSLAKQNFTRQFFSRKDYILFHKTISSATASRDLLSGVKNRILQKSGHKALTRYRFK